MQIPNLFFLVEINFNYFKWSSPLRTWAINEISLSEPRAFGQIWSPCLKCLVKLGLAKMSPLWFLKFYRWSKKPALSSEKWNFDEKKMKGFHLAVKPENQSINTYWTYVTVLRTYKERISFSEMNINFENLQTHFSLLITML